jgi:tRNA-Thr(GGU) m(6)t(6)A37 methyltransferase TsaA
LDITLQAVGIVQSPFVEDDESRDWSEIESQIVVDEALAPGLQGLSDYADIVVTFVLHRFTFDLVRDLVQQPNVEPVGIFALRSYHRPNAIGTTTVRLLGVDGRVLRVRGLDALDGSPVLDIKPYMPPLPRRTGSLPAVDPEI